MPKAYRYGIEIECSIAEQTANVTDSAMRSIRYGTHSPVYVSSDGSVSSPNDCVGREYKIGVCSMRELERILPSIQRILEQGDCSVNTSCGLHVHVSNRHFTSKKYLKRIIHAWLAVEDVFMRTQPRSRQANRYAMRFLRSYFNNRLDDLPQGKSKIISKLSNTDRYYALNLASLGEHGTIECRLHSGSYNATKILNWVRLLTSFYEYCIERYNPEAINALIKLDATDLVKCKAVLNDMLRLPPKLASYYLARINQFSYARLADQQKALNQALELKPELDKHVKRVAIARQRMETVENAWRDCIRVMGAN